MKRRLATTFAVLLLLLVAAVPAWAVLERMGPVSIAPSIGGYPAWFQDTTGLTMEFCDPTNQAELNGGWCLLLPPTPATAPETFPTNFFGEHFYWAATNVATHPNGAKLRFIMALEGAFVNGAVVPGDQMTFGRLRLVINPVPAAGDYTVYHPYGVWRFPGVAAGGRLFVTEDIGVGCPGTFACTLETSIGPYLLPSPTPGGAEVPAVPYLVAGQDPWYDALPTKTPYPNTGKIYIADPARIGPVTGSPLPPFLGNDNIVHNHNTLRIEGPGGFVWDLPNNFALMGRVFEGAIGGAAKVDRASYARSATATKVDVYATGFPSTQGRIPAGPAPAQIPTTLSFFDAPCTPTLDANGNPGPPYSAPVGAVLNQMFSAGSNYFGEGHPSPIPADVCVQANATDAAGQTVTTYMPGGLGDQVYITEALYDPAGHALSVKANSSDQLVQQTLTVEGFGAIDPLTGQLFVPSLQAPPANVFVTSSARGQNQFQVSTGTVAGAGGGSGTGAPGALDDTGSVNENCAATATTTPCATPLSINVLANDTDANGTALSPATTTVALVSQPLLGSAVVNLDGTISYTPKLFAWGTDSFTYKVTVGTLVSNAATVTVTINHINQTPTAVNDTIFAANNKLNTFNVLANDTDPDSTLAVSDLANAVILTSAPQLGTLTVTGGVVSFTPTSPGTYTFTYQAVDKGGLRSNTATATVNVNSAENITVSKSQYVVSRNRWTVSGTDSIPAGQTITIFYANGSLTGFEVGMTAVDALGNWIFDVVGLTGNYDPRTSGATKLTIKSSLGGTASATINLK